MNEDKTPAPTEAPTDPQIIVLHPYPPATETGRILDFAEFRKHSDTIIESGSGGGDGIRQMIRAGYNLIRSVEAKDTYFKTLEHAFATEMAVQLYFGMSKDKFPEMLADVTTPAVFFLDAHVSGPNGAGHEDYMEKGNASEYAQDNCLRAELEIVLAHRNDHVIIIDDQNGENEENIKYREMCLAANPSYKFYFYDEHRAGGTFYKNKSLVAIPA